MCYKCNGTGYIREFSHVQNGVCFACGGGNRRQQEPMSYKDGDYGVACRLVGEKITSLVLCKTWEDAYMMKQRRIEDDKYADVRIVKHVNGKWLDRKQFLQSVGSAA